MKKTALLILAFLFITAGFAQHRKKAEPNFLLLKNAEIIDVISGTIKTGSVLIKNEKIESVLYEDNNKLLKGTVVYDLTGKYLIPGIIDGHVHITHGTFEEAKAHLKTALKNGVTGVRDMGGDGRMLTLLKKNMQIGEDQGPDIFFSTIIAGPKFFETDPRPQSVALGAKAGEVSWQRAITPETNFRKIISEIVGMGATAIKIYANVDKDLMKKVCDEAKKQGLKIWGHAAIPPTRPSEVCIAGVRAMSHAGDLIQYELVDELKDRHQFESRKEAMKYRKKMAKITWDKNTPKVKRVFELMKKNNSVLDATLFVYDNRVDRNRTKEKTDSTALKHAMKTTKTAYEAGVKICAGSDSMIDPSGYRINIHKELELLNNAGLKTIDVLRAATIINAEVLGEKDNIGSIEKGKLANLVVLNGNPLEDIKNTRKIKYVIKRGKVIQ
ncbi:MAG: amidohydrolase family protein [Rhodothermaceae bacterium]